MSKLVEIEKIVAQIKQKENYLAQVEQSLENLVGNRFESVLQVNGSTFHMKDYTSYAGYKILKSYENIQKELVNMHNIKISGIKSEIEGLYFKLKKV